MPTRTLVVALGTIALLALGAGGLLALTDRAATATPGARHMALHINCPPGSHGKPRYARFGESLGYRREAHGDTPLPLRARSITAPATGE